MIASVDNGRASVDINDIRPLYHGKCLNDKVCYYNNVKFCFLIIIVFMNRF